MKANNVIPLDTIEKAATHKIKAVIYSGGSNSLFVRLEKHKVATLLRNKQLVASDVKCLKKSSKELLMKLCLENCLDT